MTTDNIKPVLGVLGGMGPLATVDFLRKLIEETPAARDEDHLPVIAWSVPQIPDRPAAITGNGESPLPALLAGVHTLKAAGAVALAIPCNTAHYWYDDMAGTALGLTLPQTYRFVLLPMAFRIVMPPLTSEFLNIIKNSSVALTIGLLELTGRARAMQEFSFKVFEAFSAATVIYLITNLVIVLLMRVIENKIRVPGFIASASSQITPGH